MFNRQVPTTPSDSQPLKESHQVSRNYTKALLVLSSKLRGIQVYLMFSLCMSTRHLASQQRGWGGVPGVDCVAHTSQLLEA